MSATASSWSFGSFEANPYRYRRKPPLVASGEDQEKPNGKIPGTDIFSRLPVPSQANHG
jgi:hypothetical protein